MAVINNNKITNRGGGHYTPYKQTFHKLIVFKSYKNTSVAARPVIAGAALLCLSEVYKKCLSGKISQSRQVANFSAIVFWYANDKTLTHVVGMIRYICVLQASFIPSLQNTNP